MGRLERLNFTQKQRRRFFAQNGPHCYYCGLKLSVTAFRIEHKTPLSRGGNNTKENRALSCLGCDTDKENRTVEEFRLLRELQTGQPYKFHFEKGQE